MSVDGEKSHEHDDGNANADSDADADADADEGGSPGRPRYECARQLHASLEKTFEIRDAAVS